MKEWRPIKGFEGRYEVSSDGEIASLPRDYKYGTIAKRTILKQDLTRGYYRVTLFKNGIRHRRQVHVIVAETFVANPYRKPFVNHMDENKQNNSARNLMWCTAKENANWGTSRLRISEHVSKPVGQYTPDGTLVHVWSSATKAALATKTHLSSISACAHGKFGKANGYIWRYLNERNKMVG